jgi:SAM-dependent methyltransferase
MTVPTFAARKKAWSSPPVDDIGYIPSSELIAMPHDEFANLMNQFWQNRYHGWRNYEGRWVQLFGMYEGGITGKRILDYGCGTGMEGAQYATLGNDVFLADIGALNLRVAERLFGLYACKPEATLLIEDGPPPAKQFVESLDVIHCCGVLHHIPEPEPVVEAMHGWLAPGGRLHLMVYSEIAWMIAASCPPPRDIPIVEHPQFEAFWTRWDAVGGYADWYDKARLEQRFGQWFRVKKWQYLTQDRAYLGAVLVKR